MVLPGRGIRPRRGLRSRWRLRRQLAGITKSLAKDATLTAKFAMFNALNKGEPPSGAEPLPRFQWRLPPFGWPLTLLAGKGRSTGKGRPARKGPARNRLAWRGRVIAIVAIAAVIVSTLVLSSLLRPVGRTCLMLASSGAQASASAAPSTAGQPASASVPGEPVGGFARGPGSTCPAYPVKK